MEDMYSDMSYSIKLVLVNEQQYLEFSLRICTMSGNPRRSFHVVKINIILFNK